MAHYNDDWLDSFEEEPLFGSEEYEGVDRTSYDTMISRDQAYERNSGPSVENSLSECQNVGHAGMMPTRGATHEDTVHHPGEIDLPCGSIFPNNHSAGILQTGPCGSNGNHCSICEKEVTECMEQYQSCPNMSTRAIESTVENSPEIS